MNETLKIVEYLAAEGAPFNNSRAETIGKYLKDLYDEMGKLTPQILVDHAIGSPVEDIFDWNNIKAGNSWRLEQARQIINHVLIVIQNGDETVTRAFHSIIVDVVSIEDPNTLNKTRIYKPTIEILQNPTETKLLLADIIKMLVNIADRYQVYEELAPVFKAINKVRNKYGI